MKIRSPTDERTLFTVKRAVSALMLVLALFCGCVGQGGLAPADPINSAVSVADGSSVPADNGQDGAMPGDGAEEGGIDVPPDADASVPDVSDAPEAGDANPPPDADAAATPDAADVPDASVDAGPDADVPPSPDADASVTLDVLDGGDVGVDVATDDGPPPDRGATCGNGVCEGPVETCLNCSEDCPSGYSELIHEYTGSIGAAMASVDIRLRNAADSPITGYVRNPCRGGLTVIAGGYRCIVDVARLMMACGTGNPTGTHVVFRDRAGNRIITSRTPGSPGAACYSGLGMFSCLRSTSAGRLYTSPIYVNFRGEMDAQGDVFYANVGVDTPEIR